jgi:hypothetical protein
VLGEPIGKVFGIWWEREHFHTLPLRIEFVVLYVTAVNCKSVSF